MFPLNLERSESGQKGSFFKGPDVIVVCRQLWAQNSLPLFVCAPTSQQRQDSESYNFLSNKMKWFPHSHPGQGRQGRVYGVICNSKSCPKANWASRRFEEAFSSSPSGQVRPELLSKWSCTKSIPTHEEEPHLSPSQESWTTKGSFSAVSFGLSLLVDAFATVEREWACLQHLGCTLSSSLMFPAMHILCLVCFGLSTWAFLVEKKDAELPLLPPPTLLSPVYCMIWV